MKEFNNKEQDIIQFFLKTKMEQEESPFPPGARAPAQGQWNLLAFK